MGLPTTTVFHPHLICSLLSLERFPARFHRACTTSFRNGRCPGWSYIRDGQHFVWAWTISYAASSYLSKSLHLGIRPVMELHERWLIANGHGRNVATSDTDDVLGSSRLLHHRQFLTRSPALSCIPRSWRFSSGLSLSKKGNRKLSPRTPIFQKIGPSAWICYFRSNLSTLSTMYVIQRLRWGNPLLEGKKRTLKSPFFQ